jgi:parvulin-like peptidyl-prolyl isomerase
MTNPPPARPRRFATLAWQDNANRSLLLWGLGAISGLAVAGVSLFTAKGTVTNSIPPEYVAMVNQRPIFVVDFATQLKTEFNVPLEQSTAAQRKKVLDEMIREELFVQRGLELDEPEVDIDVRNALVASVQSQIAVDATSQTPTAAELKAFYDRNQARYQSIGFMTVEDLIPRGAASLDQLAKASQALRAGQPVDKVMAQYGLKDSHLADGEQIYFSAQLHLGPKLFDAAKGLDSGGASDPVLGPDGFHHIIYMKSNNKPRPRDFALAYNEIYVDYRQNLLSNIQSMEFGYLQKKSDIQINKAYVQ